MSVVRAIAVFLVGFLVGTDGQVPDLGGCPKVEVVQNFDVQAYLGKWYENQKYFALFELGGRCITAEYSSTDTEGVVKVVNTQYNALTMKPSSIEGTATLADSTGDAKLGVEFPSVPFGRVAPYWVLGTDYTSYAVVWSCSEVAGVANARIAWILTRDRQPSQSVIEKAYAVLDKNNISRTPLITTNQTNCPEN